MTWMRLQFGSHRRECQANPHPSVKPGISLRPHPCSQGGIPRTSDHVQLVVLKPGAAFPLRSISMAFW
jgi:hypothetical protein